MSLSINPLSTLVASVSESISKATNEAQSSLPNVGDALSKSNLDSLVGKLSGGIGSGLNGITAGASGLVDSAKGIASNVSGSVSGLAGSASTALGGIGNVASSIPGVGAGISSLQSVTGSISNVGADISGSLNKLAGGNLAGGLMQAAGAISKSAGMLNNLLSLTRGANLPAGAELFMQQGAAIKLAPGAKNDWRVRINAEWSIFNSPLFALLKNTGGVVWPYTPNITVSTKANYSSPDTIHSNYPFQAYKNSVVDDIQISGEFTCETETDAAYWIAATTFFKTATKMFFGQGEYAGNPPIVCNLTGYGSSIFDKVPVVVKSFSVDLKEDVNYIKCNTFGTNTWVPVISTISVTVSPIYNRRRLRKFSLQDYSRGKTADGVGYI
jgi:hypothetical protein